MRRKIPLAVLSMAFLAVAMPAWAQSVRGTVTKIDPAAGKVTLDHAAIPKLDMGAMTMAYPVKDPAVLKGLKAGDKVDFDVVETGGAYTVTTIQKAK
ncbi:MULTISPECIES: copper-binding protein [unclassified Methylobacterium]|jgi:Cu/Ag efflux protein CusF|uniref:copper-binding protein n=1 Tax=unclassified Methylobacterium TaxID=2615210 RepID=UPI000700675C|nr:MULTISPECIES: copper-binding protein [unclassified Methylobacterium]KQO74826.1 RND transporter [Methylobacterium sp. Leaf89]KQO78301.1 RND transporter [Methylobacterium sp. Leaf88]KQT70406.1 RND transporter [Methylobacterium sp. Leaf465]